MADPYDDIPFTEEELLNIVSNRNPSLIDLSLDDRNIDETITNSQINIDHPGYPNIDQIITNHQINVNHPEPVVVINDNTSSNNHQEETDHNSNNDDDGDDNPPNVIGDAPLPAIYEDSTGNGNNNNNENVRNVCEGDNFGGNTHLEGINNWQINANNYEIGESSMARPAVDESFVCDCCQILRELIHTNGQDITRLEIHGRIGYVCHTVLEIQPNATSSEEYQYQVTYLKDRSLEESRQFLENYCQERVDAGFIMVQDDLASFYKTMAIGSDPYTNIVDAINFDDTNNLPLQPQPLPLPLLLPPPECVASASASTSAAVAAPTNATRPRQGEPSKKKTPLALQRERTRNLTLLDVEKYFHLPIEEAARKMNLSRTVVMKICRRGGLAHWPHRKIQSLERKISSWNSVLRTAKNLEVRARAEAEIERLQNEINRIRAEALKNFVLDDIS